MGFSVSGSFAIIFVGALLAFGVWHTAASNGFERVTEAQSDRVDETLEQRNTAVAVESVTYDAVNETLQINVTNTGSTSLSLDDTDLLVDNEYRAGWQDRATIDGTALETDLWLPGEELSTNVTVSDPQQVKLVTGLGVAASSPVTTTVTATPAALGTPRLVPSGADGIGGLPEVGLRG
ncbi:flagellin [Halosimplex carlsbadense]|nr:flagellin [Halosimplex carlsbadense]